jgi:uncharacterized phage protein gp47/JayE
MATPNYPESPKEILDRQRTDVQNALPQSDPFLRASFILAILIGNAGRFWDIYRTILNLQMQLFPWSAEGDFLRRWGLWKGIDKKPATGANGLISTEGTEGVFIPENTIYQTVGGNEYRVIDQDYEIREQILSVLSITRVGTVATVTVVADDHFYADNMTVAISGADQTEYNISAVINVTGAKTFDYEVTGSPATPASGTIKSTATFASINVLSYDSTNNTVATGIDKNIEEGGKLSLQSPIVDVNNDAYVQYSAISGGSSEETDDEYRARVNSAYSDPVAHFNVAEIDSIVLSVPGVTRSFTKEITPEAGAVTVYFMRDDDEGSPVPDPNETDSVKKALLEIKPAHMDENDLHVNEPELKEKKIDFVFSGLEINTVSLQEAIDGNLATFFKEVPEPGENIKEEIYNSAIAQTIDPATGDFVKSFTLTSPTTDINVDPDEIATLGTITWNI